MVEEHDASIADPLLRPDRAPLDVSGHALRSPVGNSIKTLLLFGVLIAAGLAVWWMRRPSDLAAELGGREWAIIEVDGEPALNAWGTLSTFVLDGTGEIRGAIDCNVATGVWSYDTRAQRLDLEWVTQTDNQCPPDWPASYLPTGGRVHLDHGDLRIEGDGVEIRAIELSERDPMPPHELHGSWVSGGHTVEIGERGRFDVGDCQGSWIADVTDERAMVVEFGDQASAADDPCALGPAWLDSAPLVVVEFDGAVYLHRDRTMFPLDRSVIRLDPAPGNGAGAPIAP